MKKLLIILLFIGFSAFSQTFEVVNKGYYYGKVGDTVLPNRTTDLKALTDVQEYLENHNLELGIVVRPSLEVKRKKTIPTPPSIIRDTVYINNGDISIGNQWMGEPITVDRGTIISDQDASNPDTKPEKAFDNDINTYAEQAKHNLGWIGREYATDVEVGGFGFLPRQLAADAIKMNKAQIQYRNDSGKWITLYVISGINESNYMNWIKVDFPPVKAKAFRIYAQQTGAFTRVAELEFYKL